MAGIKPDLRRDDLLGRERECDAIDHLLKTAAAGQSCSLVLRGDPGIGKTALLAYAQHAAAVNTVLRTSGLEAESDLAFAGLYGLLRPLADMLSELPESASRSYSRRVAARPACSPHRASRSSCSTAWRRRRRANC